VEAPSTDVSAKVLHAVKTYSLASLYWILVIVRHNKQSFLYGIARVLW